MAEKMSPIQELHSSVLYHMIQMLCVSGGSVLARSCKNKEDCNKISPFQHLNGCTSVELPRTRADTSDRVETERVQLLLPSTVAAQQFVAVKLAVIRTYGWKDERR